MKMKTVKNKQNEKNGSFVRVQVNYIKQIDKSKAKRKTKMPVWWFDKKIF